MTGRLSAWWQGRSRREQVLLAIMLVLAAITFLWLLVLRPIDDALSSARERHEKAVIALAEARAQADLIARLETRAAPPLERPLDLLLTASASEAGFSLTRITPDGDSRASLAMSSARPQAFFAWLARLQAEKGLVVEQLNVTSNSDRTLSVELTLRSRGA